MKVNATWHHVIAVTREVDVDEEEFTHWRDNNYSTPVDNDLAIAVWIDEQGDEFGAQVFSDWRTSEPLPSDFELQYSEVIDVERPTERPNGVE